MSIFSAREVAEILLDSGESTSSAIAELMDLRDMDRASAEATVQEVCLERATVVRRLRRWAPRGRPLALATRERWTARGPSRA